MHVSFTLFTHRIQICADDSSTAEYWHLKKANFIAVKCSFSAVADMCICSCTSFEKQSFGEAVVLESICFGRLWVWEAAVWRSSRFGKHLFWTLLFWEAVVWEALEIKLQRLMGIWISFCVFSCLALVRVAVFQHVYVFQHLCWNSFFRTWNSRNEVSHLCHLYFCLDTTFGLFLNFRKL